MPRPVTDPDYGAALMRSTPAERVMLRLAAEAGLRRAEVAQVHAGDLVPDLGGFSLLVHGKGQRERMVPLADDLAAAVRAQAAGGYAFPGRFGGHLTPDNVGRRLSELLPDGVSMHKLRHRFASRAYAVDTDTFTVQTLLGHASPVTTRRYVAVPRDGLRATVLAAAGGR